MFACEKKRTNQRAPEREIKRKKGENLIEAFKQREELEKYRNNEKI